MLTLGHFPPPFISVNLIIRDGNKLLLIERRDGLGLGLPGGFLGLKESVEAAAIREAKEETGLNIELKEILTVLSGKRRGSKIFTTDIVYTANIIGDKTTRDSLEGKCRWIPLSEIEDHQIAIDHIDALKLLRK
jgi:ADP-ribose pyrophosphatase YjhB (NUDIX family)